jgi:hypothetical protein
MSADTMMALIILGVIIFIGWYASDDSATRTMDSFDRGGGGGSREPAGALVIIAGIIGILFVLFIIIS